MAGEKVVCINKEGRWRDWRGIMVIDHGPVYGEVCVISEVRPPGKYPRRDEPGKVWDQQVDYYHLVGYVGWFLSEQFRPLDEIEKLKELIKAAPESVA